MLKLLLLSTFRNLWGNRLVSLITIFSMMIGLLVFSLAMLYVKRELSVNNSWQDADSIHRLTYTRNSLPGYSDTETSGVNTETYQALGEYFSDEITALTRVTSYSAREPDMEQNDGFSMMFVDADFADIFQFEVLSGSMAEALSAPYRLAISEDYALLLGEKGKIGSVLRLVGISGNESDFEIVAHFRKPVNTSVMGNGMISLIDDSLIPFFNNESGLRVQNWMDISYVWIKLQEGLGTEEFNARQQDFVSQKMSDYANVLTQGQDVSDYVQVKWQSLPDYHMHPLSSENALNRGDKGRVLTYAVVGLMVLLVACSNSISLSLSAVLRRQKEIGIRKAAGAGRLDIVQQYLGEPLLLSLVSLLPVLLVLAFGMDVIYQLSPAMFSNQTLITNHADYALLVIIALSVGLLNGVYPAFVLAEYKPQGMLKSAGVGYKYGFPGMRNLLVTTQFIMAVVLLIGTAALYMQLHITRNQNIGFSAENQLVVYANQNTQGKVGAILNRLSQIPGVESAIPIMGTVGMSSQQASYSTTLLRSGEDVHEIQVAYNNISPGFFQHFKIPLLAGREYEYDRDEYKRIQEERADQNSAIPLQERRPFTIVLNRTAILALGYDSPDDAIGKILYRQYSGQTAPPQDFPYEIIGVAEDSMTSSLKYRPGPEMYNFYPQQMMYMAGIRYQDSVEEKIQAEVDQVLVELTDYKSQFSIFLEDQFFNAFSQERGESLFLLICGAMAFVLSCIGLFGLATFTMGRNVKEVGIRKALGSDVSMLMRLFMWRFSKPVLVANLIGTPVALYFVLQWIEQFPYQLEKIWLLPIALGTAAAVLLVSLLTVGWITFRAASERPVMALRYE